LPEGKFGARLRSDTLDRGRAARVLVVGGLDPSGAAGVTADGAALDDHGGTWDAVLTARTDQDDRQVRSVGARDPDDWLEEARSVSSRGRVDALKLGLLPGAEHVRRAARLVEDLRERWPDLPVVVDPVVASSSGFEFLDETAQATLCTELLAREVVLTPNLPEAVQLVGGDAQQLAELTTEPPARLPVARRLLEMGARAVVLKGGHGTGDLALDLVLENGSDAVWVEQERQVGNGIRGSGCRHASVLAWGLASGADMATAARRAASYVAACIRAAGPKN